jgi:hypothetical protein
MTLIEKLRTMSYRQISELFRDPAVTIAQALFTGDPALLDWHLDASVVGCFRLVRIVDGKAVEGILVLNAPESERTRYEAKLDMSLICAPMTLIFAGEPAEGQKR